MHMHYCLHAAFVVFLFLWRPVVVLLGVLLGLGLSERLYVDRRCAFQVALSPCQWLQLTAISCPAITIFQSPCPITMHRKSNHPYSRTNQFTEKRK